MTDARTAAVIAVAEVLLKRSDAPFRPFPPVSGQYGAPMGRRSENQVYDVILDDYLTVADLAAAGPVWEYDSGGAYWGLPIHHPLHEGPVWAVWIRGHGRDGVVYVRARSAKSAKIIVLKGSPA